MKVNPYNEPLWREAVNQFHQSLHPTEERVASKLKTQLRSVNANTLQVSQQLSTFTLITCWKLLLIFHIYAQLLQEFKRYQELIELDNVRRTLVPERENLLSLLLEYVHSEAANFPAGPKGNEVLDLPPIVSSICWARQLEFKVCVLCDKKCL